MCARCLCWEFLSMKSWPISGSHEILAKHFSSWVILRIDFTATELQRWTYGNGHSEESNESKKEVGQATEGEEEADGRQEREGKRRRKWGGKREEREEAEEEKMKKAERKNQERSWKKRRGGSGERTGFFSSMTEARILRHQDLWWPSPEVSDIVSDIVNFMERTLKYGSRLNH